MASDAVNFATRQERDAAYDARNSVPPDVFAAALGEYRRRSQQALRLPGAAPDIVYDTVAKTTLDLFPAQAQGLSPAFIFIHGGAWQKLSSKDSAFMAENFTRHGISVVAIDYDLVPTVEVGEIVRQVRSAIAWLYHHGTEYGIDPQRLHISGSSAGAHLSAMAMSRGWHDAARVPDTVIASGCLFSGLYDMRPLQASSHNDPLKLDEAAAARLSPALLPPAAVRSVDFYWAAGQPPGFGPQSRLYAQRLRAAGLAVTATEVSGRNHFDDVLDLSDPNSAIARRCFAVIHGSA